MTRNQSLQADTTEMMTVFSSNWHLNSLTCIGTLQTNFITGYFYIFI